MSLKSALEFNPKETAIIVEKFINKEENKFTYRRLIRWPNNQKTIKTFFPTSLHVLTNITKIPHYKENDPYIFYDTYNANVLFETRSLAKTERIEKSFLPAILDIIKQDPALSDATWSFEDIKKHLKNNLYDALDLYNMGFTNVKSIFPDTANIISYTISKLSLSDQDKYNMQKWVAEITQNKKHKDAILRICHKVGMPMYPLHHLEQLDLILTTQVTGKLYAELLHYRKFKTDK